MKQERRAKSKETQATKLKPSKEFNKMKQKEGGSEKRFS